jgi:hypothetical protein
MDAGRKVSRCAPHRVQLFDLHVVPELGGKSRHPRNARGGVSAAAAAAFTAPAPAAELQQFTQLAL